MASATLCPRFHRAIELIGGRWTGPILQILQAGPARFAALREAIPQISDRMLSERLHELEAEGIVIRSVIPESPVRVEYSLTQKGRDLHEPLDAVGRWAERWITLPHSGPPSAQSVAQSVPERRKRPAARKPRNATTKKV